MSAEKKFTWRDWFLTGVFCFSLVLIGLHLFLFSDSSGRLFAKRIQHAVENEDRVLHDTKKNLSYYLDSLSHDSFIFSELYDVSFDNDIYVFYGDSIVFWNNNILQPKLLRKRVPVDCDTLVHLNSGDYLVVSGSQSGYSYYCYRLINSTYSFENDFFESKFQILSGNRQIQLTSSPDDSTYPLYSSSGQLLTYFRIQTPSSLAKETPWTLAIYIVVLILSVYLLVLRRIPVFSSSKSSTFQIYLPLFCFLLFFVVAVLGFKALFRYGFEQGFFIPGSLSVGKVIIYYFLSFLFFITVLLLINKLFSKFADSMGKTWIPFTCFTVLFLGLALALHFHWITFMLGCFMMIAFIGTFALKLRSKFLPLVIQLVFWSLLLTHLYSQEYTRFEEQGIRKLAETLGQERDPDFENSYHHFLEVAQHDTTFFSTVLSDDVMEEVAEDYIRSFLFDTVMNQYNVKLTLCNPGAELIVAPFDLVSDCMGYFQDKVNNNHGVDLGEGLAFLDYNTLDPSYLSMINILVNDSITDMSLFLEFSKPIAPQSYGLMNLLQNGSSTLPPNTSVACYEDGLLVYKYGSHVYPNYLLKYKNDDFSYGPKTKHYSHEVENSKVLVISVERRGFLLNLLPFVFFFVVLLILYLLVYFMVFMNSRNATLSRKFQMIILGTLAVAFFIVGPVSVFYMRKVYTDKSNDYYYERSRTLLQNISSEVDFSSLKHVGFNYGLDRILKRYSETFYTDINVYGLNGKLLSTTSPDLQEMQLQASLMNAEAYQSMQGEKSIYFIHDEQLGQATYPSAYISVMDGMGNGLAYLNIPHFSGRSGLRNEIVNFILTYVNIILLFTIFLIFPIILLLTRRVTFPLHELQDKLANIDITKPNELLEWKSKDEIGELVDVYNAKVVELEQQVEELKRNYTESAWRSAARQVAHEINNSLTPMRLSMQLLEKSVADHAEDLEDRIKRTSVTLIEQIDALTNIASEFSRYAKLPENHLEPLDLAELLHHVTNLYNNEDNIDVQFSYDKNQSYIFNGDKTNLNSVFSNLIKNATQAIGSKPNGLIEVVLEATENSYHISVKDNGKGIKEEDKKMIFLPNFTTKSSGSGIGLSLTYNNVVSLGGTISFKSQEGEGAEFIIEFPKNINDSIITPN